MQALLDSETADLGVFSFPNPHIRWKSHATFKSIVYNNKQESKQIQTDVWSDY